MTYIELVDRIERICDYHQMIRDFGYGALSDLKTVNRETNETVSWADTPYVESLTNYPYVFLNPTQSTRSSNAITYRFNMIVMDLVNDRYVPGPYDTEPAGPAYRPYLQIQSDCQQYIDDIMAGLRFGLYNDASFETEVKFDPEMDIQVSYNLTPFKERFADTVAGMTATLEIEVAQPLNKCIAPYPPSS
jgi:hypothetical protein